MWPGVHVPVTQFSPEIALVKNASMTQAQSRPLEMKDRGCSALDNQRCSLKEICASVRRWEEVFFFVLFAAEELRQISVTKSRTLAASENRSDAPRDWVKRSRFADHQDWSLPSL